MRCPASGLHANEESMNMRMGLKKNGLEKVKKRKDVLQGDGDMCLKETMLIYRYHMYDNLTVRNKFELESAWYSLTL